MSGSFLLEVQELSRPSNICSISVRWYTSIKDIKDLLRNHFNAPPSRISIFHSSVPKALPNQFTLHDLGIEQDGHTLKVSINVQSSKSFVLFPSKDIEVDQNCKDMISISRQGFERSQIPGKTDLFDCTGGVYFLRAPSGEKHAVFKPNDEEQGMPNNPKGHAGSGVEALRPFFLPGRGYIRETAAYLMDFKNFCQVPPTTIVHCEHQCFNYPKNQGSSGMFPKVGSLQKFIYASDTFEDISPSLISTFELQKIAILDIRLLNCDRNSSNILCLRKPAPSYPSTRCGGRRDSRSSSMGSFPDEYDEDAEFNPFQDELPPSSFSANGAERPADYYELIPIDHGYCIPSRLKIDELDWAWFYCSQIAAEVDPEIRRYVLSLDVDQLVDDLAEQLKIPDVSCFLLRLSHHLLVEGIKAGLSLFTIAGLIARTSEDEPSFLEKAIKLAEENAYRTIEVRSNRLNSRGDSRAASFGSQSGSFLSPSRLRPFPSASSISRDISASMSDPVDAGSLDNSLYGHGRLSKFIDDQPDFTAGKRHRVVQSSANLEALVGQAMAKSTSTSKYAAFAATLQAAERPLSIENMEKLQLLNAGHGSQEHDDFYLAELSPQTYKAAAPAMEETHEEGIALNLVAPHELEGSKLVIMHSVDSATHSARFKSSHSSRSEKAPSRFSCGRLEEEEEAAAPPRPNVSADIAIPSPKKTGGLSPESDLTSCEASSKEDEACSPRSFGDNFFLTGESLLHRPSVPFGKSDHPLLATIDGSAGGSGKERPFPPRSSPLPPSGASRDCAEKRAKTSSHSPFYPNSDEDPETDMEVQDAMRLGISGSSQCGGLSAAGNIRRNDTSQASFLSKGAGTVTPTPLSGLQRVASFNAFESPALYEDRQTSHRQMKVLYKEQRKAISKTPEFLELRLKFARAAVNSFIAKEFKAKSKY